MIDITIEQINAGIDKADEATLILLANIEDSSEILGSAQKAGIQSPDYRIIVGKTKYFLLGLINIVQLVEEIGDSISAEGPEVSAFISQFLQYILLSQGERLRKLEINRNPECISVIDEIIESANESIGRETNSDHEKLSASSILSEIENPTPSVARPDFALPKTKPSTAEVLKSLSSMPNQPASPTTTAATDQSLDLSIDTDSIIDPFKDSIKPQPTAPTAPVTPAASQQAIPSTLEAQIASRPVSQIQERMDAKLASVTGTQSKETFGVMNASSKKPFHDPYREPIE